MMFDMDIDNTDFLSLLPPKYSDRDGTFLSAFSSSISWHGKTKFLRKFGNIDILCRWDARNIIWHLFCMSMYLHKLVNVYSKQSKYLTTHWPKMESSLHFSIIAENPLLSLCCLAVFEMTALRDTTPAKVYVDAKLPTN